jgi:hypothetical protein
MLKFSPFFCTAQVNVSERAEALFWGGALLQVHAAGFVTCSRCAKEDDHKHHFCFSETEQRLSSHHIASPNGLPTKEEPTVGGGMLKATLSRTHLQEFP